MFLFLSKFLPLFVYPVGLVFLLLWAAFVYSEKHEIARRIILFAVLVLWVSGNSWSAMALGRSLEWRYLPLAETPRAQVMVVLGGGTEPALYPRSTVEINGAGDRLVMAALLYQQGAADKILVSGGGINWMDQRQMSIAEEMAQLLVLMGVPREAILLQERSANTYEDALYCAEVLAEMDVAEIILVTSAMHMPRSVALFEHQGLSVIAAPTDFKVTEAAWNAIYRPANAESVLFALIPNAGDIGTTTNAMKEYIGMFIYSLRGWM
jgi:uncharacterized SAM-binding protein YcdF (DUF218 family)